MKPLSFFLCFLISIGGFWSCDLKEISDEIEPTNNTDKLPKADFTITKSSDYAPSNVMFNNTSINAKSYVWSLGNNTSSSQISPTKTYSSAGSYSIQLIAKDSLNRADTLTQILTIRQRGFDTTDGNFGPIRKVIPLANGEFVMAGTTTLTNPMRSEAYVMKRDAFGREVSGFTKKISFGVRNDVYDLIDLGSNNFGICGSTFNGSTTDAFFAVIRPNGTIDTARFGNPTFDDVAYSMVQANDGYVLFCGYGTSPTTGKDVWLTKRNPNAIRTDIRFDSLYRVNQNEEANNIILNADGSLTMVCVSVPSTGPFQTYLLKTNANGNRLTGFPRTIGAPTDYNRGRTLIAISNNRWLGSGTVSFASGEKRGWLFLTDVSGNLVSGYPLSISTSAELFDMREMDSHIGLVGVGQKANSAWFVKTNTSGIITRDTTFGTIGNNTFYAVRSLPDSGFIMVGGRNTAAYMVRTNANGVVEK